MNPRQRLAADLAATLPDTYRVAARTATPDRIEAGAVAVRVLAATVAPAPTVAGLTYTLTVWACTPVQDPDQVDDVLDVALDDLTAALLGLDWIDFQTAERGVMDDTWHGYRLTVNAYALITHQED